jgi:hypothetical protein
MYARHRAPSSRQPHTPVCRSAGRPPAGPRITATCWPPRTDPGVRPAGDADACEASTGGPQCGHSFSASSARLPARQLPARTGAWTLDVAAVIPPSFPTCPHRPGHGAWTSHRTSRDPQGGLRVAWRDTDRAACRCAGGSAGARGKQRYEGCVSGTGAPARSLTSGALLVPRGVSPPGQRDREPTDAGRQTRHTIAAPARPPAEASMRGDSQRRAAACGLVLPAQPTVDRVL